MLAILQTKCILMTREYIALFFSIIFCPMLLLIFGMVYGNEPSQMFGGSGTVDVMLPSFVGLVFAGTGLISLPVAVAGSRERGELRRYRMTPLSPMAFLAADVIMYFIISVIGMLIVLLIGRFGYDSSFTGSIPLLIYGFVLSGICDRIVHSICEQDCKGRTDSRHGDRIPDDVSVRCKHAGRIHAGCHG